MKPIRHLRPQFIVLALLLAAGACQKQNSTAAAASKPLPLVKAVPAKVQTLTQWFEVTGDVVAANSASIRATVDGPISFCPWREGDLVPAGEKLVLIDRPLYREELRTAEAVVAVARARLVDLKTGARPEEIAQTTEVVKQLQGSAGFATNDVTRIEQLVRSGSLPGEALEKARVEQVRYQTQLAAAQEKLQMLKAGPTVTALAVQEALVQEAAARLDRAKAALAECTLTAPFNAVISRVHVRPGDLATAKAPLLDLFEMDALVVRLGIPEAQAAEVRPGSAVVVTFDAMPERRIETKIARAYPELDPRTRTRLVEAQIPAGLGAVPGMFVRVRVAVRSLPEAVVVPETSLVVLPNGETVVFVVENEKARRRKVRVSLETADGVAVASGIGPGDLVITQGNDALKDGASIKLMEGKKKDGGGAPAPTGGSDKPAGGAKGKRVP